MIADQTRPNLCDASFWEYALIQIKAQEIWRRILHEPLGRLQATGAVAPAGGARVISSDRRTGLTFRRLFHDRPRGQLDQLVLGAKFPADLRLHR